MDIGKKINHQHTLCTFLIVRSVSEEENKITIMLPKERRSIHPSEENQKMSSLARLLRFLIKINLFPLKADYEKRQLLFTFCSWRPIAFVSVTLITVALPQVAQGRFPYSIISWFCLFETVSSKTSNKRMLERKSSWTF